ncbi:MAG: pectin acetylesterase-family hydrolase, partial [Myxococcota bacterium]|nr:pectin acetylesterase-family hydrolase [Myxococcota bacterium]
LQGGGACWSDFCFVVEQAGAGIPRLDVFEPTTSPVAGWDTMYLPYCDGSLFAGDADIDDDGDGAPDRYHRGLRNLSAALDAARMRAPNPRRILLAGSSGGGFGTLLAPALVRRLWPDVPVDVVNDAGVGVTRPGDDAFVAGLLEEWNVAGLVPRSCVDCVSDGHLTGLIDWALREDPSLRVGAFSSTRDAVIAGLFLRVAGADFETALRSELGALHDAHPARFQPFIVEGDLHTALLGDIAGFLGDADPAYVAQIESFITLGEMAEVEVDGVSVADWLGHMVTGDAAWGPQVEPDAR